MLYTTFEKEKKIVNVVHMMLCNLNTLFYSPIIMSQSIAMSKLIDKGHQSEKSTQTFLKKCFFKIHQHAQE